jgi:hypothetical protein
MLDLAETTLKLFQDCFSVLFQFYFTCRTGLSRQACDRIDASSWGPIGLGLGLIQLLEPM